MNSWRKGIASWRCGDTLYLSVVFSWDMEVAEAIAKQNRRLSVVAGGPAIDLAKRRGEVVDWAHTPESCPFDTLAMHNPCATYTSRGCDCRCRYCAVPRIEGKFRQLKKWKPAPIVCDNNILQSSRRHFTRVISSLRHFPCCDFNQGLSAPLFTEWHAKQMRQLKRVRVRFACDTMQALPYVERAVGIARKAGLTDIAVYTLIGFDDTPELALQRCNRLWDDIKVDVCPMPYQPLDAKARDEYVSPSWTLEDLQKMSRFFWRRRFWRQKTYAEYKAEQQPLFAEAAR